MRAVLFAFTLLCATAGAVHAEGAATSGEEAVEATGCPNQSSIRDAATEMDASEIVPLRGRHGREFLMLVLPTGHGLVVAKSEQGCFDTMLAMPAEAVEMVLTQSQAS